MFDYLNITEQNNKERNVIISIIELWHVFLERIQARTVGNRKIMPNRKKTIITHFIKFVHSFLWRARGRKTDSHQHNLTTGPNLMIYRVYTIRINNLLILTSHIVTQTSTDIFYMAPKKEESRAPATFNNKEKTANIMDITLN